MTDPVTRLHAAEADAAVARERLSTTIGRLQDRLDPGVLVEEARAAGELATQAAIDGARRNPVTVAGAIGALGLFLVRHKIAARWRRRNASKPLPARPRKD